MSNQANERYQATYNFCGDFIAYLQRLYDDGNGRAAMAALRRSVGKIPDEAFEAHKYLARWTMGEEIREWQKSTMYLIAGLFAIYPDKSTDTGSIGRHLADACNKAEGIRPSTAESYLNRLLKADPDDLVRHLSYVIRLLQSKEQPINWLQLMLDVWFWRNPEPALKVKYRWSEDFWSAIPEDKIEN